MQNTECNLKKHNSPPDLRPPNPHAVPSTFWVISLSWCCGTWPFRVVVVWSFSLWFPFCTRSLFISRVKKKKKEKLDLSGLLTVVCYMVVHIVMWWRSWLSMLWSWSWQSSKSKYEICQWMHILSWKFWYNEPSTLCEKYLKYMRHKMCRHHPHPRRLRSSYWSRD